MNTSSPGWRWEHSYARLPELFFIRTRPVAVRDPNLLVFNTSLAGSLGLNPDSLQSAAQNPIFTGNYLPARAYPIAQAYAGHQYGHFTSLGDGRAILLGEHITPDGRRVDIQLKGSGRTPFSRNGDGRAALGPMLREYIISEAMHALGIPTTRSLAVATTGENVARAEMLPGAILTRVAASHIRVGTFQWAAAHQDVTALKALADHTLLRHFPEIDHHPAPYVALLEAIMNQQTSLIAKWLHVGFVHGVMNTDNMALSGETIDYGPCAFIDAYDPATVFSSIDRHGRYAYGKQPEIARWNLTRLAEAMLPIMDEDEKTAVDLANQVIDAFEPRFQAHWLDGMRAKLGLITQENQDAALIQALLDWMHRQQLDFTQTFRALSAPAAIAAPPFAHNDSDFSLWHAQWAARLARQPQPITAAVEQMLAHNPAVIPRNHKVEEALAAAENHHDLSVMQHLLDALAAPYQSGAAEEFTQAPTHKTAAYQTFCGT